MHTADLKARLLAWKSFSCRSHQAFSCSCYGMRCSEISIHHGSIYAFQTWHYQAHIPQLTVHSLLFRFVWKATVMLTSGSCSSCRNFYIYNDLYCTSCSCSYMYVTITCKGSSYCSHISLWLSSLPGEPSGTILAWLCKGCVFHWSSSWMIVVTVKWTRPIITIVIADKWIWPMI